MPDDVLTLPSYEMLRSHVLRSLERYWMNSSEQLLRLPIVNVEGPCISGPLRLHTVKLPYWAADCGINGELLVPQEACTRNNSWIQVDWWLAAFLLLECWHERLWEIRKGCIHSYSFHLNGWDARVWERAWVNRIALFLREWVAWNQKKNSEEVFGSLPKVEFLVTHDVDAIKKTLPIRLKQGVFNIWNMGKALTKRNIPLARKKATIALKFFFGQEDWWTLDELLELEHRAGIRSVFHFYADSRMKTPRRWIFDPGYDIAEYRLQTFVHKLVDFGFTVGLHPSFCTFQDSREIINQRKYLEKHTGIRIEYCRQHWLRFSWKDTWRAQQEAGLCLDTTLMFNDRPGFRASAALAWCPWKPEESRPHGLKAIPSLFMDSHFFDYQEMEDSRRKDAIQFWAQECKFVGGKVAVLWHPQTLSRDYGWQSGFETMLQAVND